MDGWFEGLAEAENPTRQHLLEFLQETDRLLSFLMADWPAEQLFWRNDRATRLAWVNYTEYIRPELMLILERVADMPDETLETFGLVGPLAALKYQILHRAFSLWRDASQRSMRGIVFTRQFTKAMSAVGTILRSIVSGLGGLPGEFILEAVDALQSIEKSKSPK